MIPEITFCIHENGLPNNVCKYPCPYGNNNNSVSYMDSLDLSDISDYEDNMMTTSNDEAIARIERSALLNSGLLEHLLNIQITMQCALNFIHYPYEHLIGIFIETLTCHFYSNKLHIIMHIII